MGFELVGIVQMHVAGSVAHDQIQIKVDVSNGSIGPACSGGDVDVKKFRLPVGVPADVQYMGLIPPEEAEEMFCSGPGAAIAFDWTAGCEVGDEPVFRALNKLDGVTVVRTAVVFRGVKDEVTHRRAGRYHAAAMIRRIDSQLQR
jgi:hypothetical protein